MWKCPNVNRKKFFGNFHLYDFLKKCCPEGISIIYLVLHSRHIFLSNTIENYSLGVKMHTMLAFAWQYNNSISRYLFSKILLKEIQSKLENQLRILEACIISTSSTKHLRNIKGERLEFQMTWINFPWDRTKILLNHAAVFFSNSICKSAWKLTLPSTQ